MPEYREKSVCYFYDDIRWAGGTRHRSYKSKAKSTGAATLRKLAEWICWAKEPKSATRKYFKQVVGVDIFGTPFVTYGTLNRQEREELSQLVEDIKFEKLLRGAGVT